MLLMHLPLKTYCLVGHGFTAIRLWLPRRFDFQDGQLRRINADLRPFTVTESFYSDAQYYELASGPVDAGQKATRHQEPRFEVVERPKEEEPGRSKVQPEARVEIQHSIQEKVRADMPNSRFYIQEDRLDDELRSSGRFHIGTGASSPRGQQSVRGRGRSRGPSGQFTVVWEPYEDRLREVRPVAPSSTRLTSKWEVVVEQVAISGPNQWEVVGKEGQPTTSKSAEWQVDGES